MLFFFTGGVECTALPVCNPLRRYLYTRVLDPLCAIQIPDLMCDLLGTIEGENSAIEIKY